MTKLQLNMTNSLLTYLIYRPCIFINGSRSSSGHRPAFARRGPVHGDLHDLDGNGVLDVVVFKSSIQDTLSVFSSDGQGGFGTGTDHETGSHPRAVLARDLRTETV
jgi:hypothetical protein